MWNVCSRVTRITLLLGIFLLFGCGIKIRALKVANLERTAKELRVIALSTAPVCGGHFNFLESSGPGETKFTLISRDYPHAVEVGNEIMIIGGANVTNENIVQGRINNNGGDSSTTEFLNLGTGAIRRGGPLPSPMTFPNLFRAADGAIYILGFVTGAASTSAYKYNSTSNTWISIAPLPGGLSKAYAFDIPGGKIGIAGNYSSGNPPYFSKVYEYDPANDQWRTTAVLDPNFSGSPLFAKLSDGKIAISYSNWPNRKTTLYDPLTEAVEVLPNLADRGGGQLIAGDNGSVLFVGGLQPGPPYFTPQSDIWRPSTGTWSAGPQLPFPRAIHKAFKLSDGNSVLFLDNATIEYNAVGNTFGPLKAKSYSDRHNAENFLGDVLELSNGGLLQFANTGFLWNAGTSLELYSQGGWSVLTLPERTLAQGLRPIGVSSDAKTVVYADSRGSAFYTLDRNTGKLSSTEFLNPQENRYEAIQYSDDEILFYIPSIIAPDGLYSGNGGLRTGIYNLSNRTLVPGPDRTIPSSDPFTYEFGNRYVLFHSGATYAGPTLTQTLSPFEIFDGQTKTWKAIGIPIHAYRDAAIAYDDSENALYFFAGGQDSGFPYNLANKTHVDRYDLGSDTWTAIAIPQAPRTLGMAFSLGNGKFIVAGGSIQPGNSYQLLDLVGMTATTRTTGFTSDLWRIGGNSRQDQYYQRFSPRRLADGRISFPTSSPFYSDTFFLYDSSNDSWAGAAPNPANLYAYANHILRGPGNQLSMTYPGVPDIGLDVYDPAANTWSPAIPSAIVPHVLTANEVRPVFIAPLGDGKTLYASTRLVDGTISAKSYIFDMRADTLTPVQDAPATFSTATQVFRSADNSIALYTPTNGTDPSNYFRFDAASGLWSGPFTAPFGTRYYVSVAQHPKGGIILAGGMDPNTGVVTPDVVWLDPDSNTTIALPQLPLSYTNCVLFNIGVSSLTGRTLIAGGVDLITLLPVKEIHTLDENSANWIAGPALPKSRIFSFQYVDAENFLYLVSGTTDDLGSIDPSVYRVNVDSVSTSLEVLPDVPMNANFNTMAFAIGSYADGLSIYQHGAGFFTVKQGDSAWTLKAPPEATSVVGKMDAGTALVWGLVGDDGALYYSKIHAYSAFQTVSFIMDGGTAPYTFDSSANGDSFLFDAHRKFLPYKRGKYRITGADALGARFTSQDITATP